MNARRSSWIWLSFILITAVILRCINLNAGLWYDEILTLVHFIRLPILELLSTYTSLNNHILYSLEAKATIALFGENAIGIRLPAVAFGVGSIAALWWLASSLLTKWEVRFTTLLLAVSYHHIWFSQNARGYTGLLFWGIVATLIFIRCIDKPSKRLFVAYAFTFAAAMYTHLSAGFLFASHAIAYVGLNVLSRISRAYSITIPIRNYAGFSSLMPLLGLGLGAIFVLVLYSPVIPSIFDNIQNMVQQSPGQAVVSEWKNPLWTLLDIIRNLRELGFVVGIGLPIVFVFFLIGLWNLFRLNTVLAMIIVIHIPLTLLILLLLSFRIWPRYFFIDLAFVFLCLVHGVFHATNFLAKIVRYLPNKSESGNYIGIFACSIAVLCSLLLLPTNYKYPKQDFQGAKEFITENSKINDSIASFGLASLAFSSYYSPDWTIIKSRNELENLIEISDRTWLVYSFPTHTSRKFPGIMELISSNFDLVANLPGTLGDGNVLIYLNEK